MKNNISKHPGRSSASEQQTLTILYIEDNRNNLKLVSKLITQFNLGTLLEACNAEEGLEIAQKKLPDVILLDISLPGMDGYQALLKLRQNETTKNIPVLAVTSHAHPDEIKNGLQAGFNHYITKPINIEKLIDSIKFVTSA